MAEIIQETYEIISVDVGSSPGTTTDNVPGIDFVTADNALYSLANRGANALEIPSSGNKYSYEKYIKFGATSVPSGYTLSNFKVWASDVEVATGINMYWRQTDTYVDPVRPTSAAGFRKQATNYNSSASTNTGWSQKQKILASNAESPDYFAYHIAMDKEYAIIGAMQEDTTNINSGAAYIYTMSGGNWWNEQVMLKASDAASGDYLGFGVDISGDYAIAGAYNKSGGGAAYIFTISGSTWVQQTKLVASDGASGDQFGNQVGIDGDYAIVGANKDHSPETDGGSAYIFTRSGTSWNQQAKIVSDDNVAGDKFGISVSIAGDYALIGANGQTIDANNDGAAYVFTRSGTSWNQTQKLTMNDGGFTGGNNDNFGFYSAISSDANYLVVSAHDRGSGEAFVYTRSGTDWSHQAVISASDGASGDELGYKIAIDGDYIIAGAGLNHSPTNNAGAAYIFHRDGVSWTQHAKIAASDQADSDKFGLSCAIYKNRVLIGTLHSDTNTGSAYYYKRDNTALTISGSISSSGDYTNYLVAMLEVAPGAALNTVPNMTFNYSFDGPGQTFLGRFNGTITDDITGDSGTFTEGMDFRDVKPGGSKIADGVMVTDSDDLRFSSGGYVNDAEHCYKGLTLNGTNQYCTSTASGLTPTGDLLITANIKRDNEGSEETIVGRWDEEGDNRGYRLYINSSNKLCFDVSGDGTVGDVISITGNTSITDNTWYSVGASFEASTAMNIFVDGLSDSPTVSGSVPALICVGGTTVFVGSKRTAVPDINTHFDGQIDNLRIFDLGPGGLYTTGYPGGAFEARIKNSVGLSLYNEAVPYSTSSPGGVVTDLHRSPYDSLTNLGFSAIESLTVSGEVAHWKFSDDLTDETSNAFNLTGIGTPTYTASYLAAAKKRRVSSPEDVFSAEFWVKTELLAGDGDKVRRGIIHQERGGDRFRLYRLNDNLYQFEQQSQDGVDLSTSGSFSGNPSSAYTHIVGVFHRNTVDGTNYMQIYIDGVLGDSDSIKPGNMTTSATEFLLGTYGSGRFLGMIHGRLYDIAIPATRENAKGRGLPEWMSVEGLYNSGAGVEGPLVNEHVVFDLVDNPN